MGDSFLLFFSLYFQSELSLRCNKGEKAFLKNVGRVRSQREDAHQWLTGGQVEVVVGQEGVLCRPPWFQSSRVEPGF